MSKKLFQLLPVVLLTTITFWNSPCQANVCYCWCGTQNNNYIGYYSFESSCAVDCLNIYGQDRICCGYNGCSASEMKNKGKGKDQTHFDPSKSRPVGSEKTNTPPKSPIKK